MTSILRALYVTPELSPWVKAGGLGDVARDLPRALAARGVDMRVLVPAFPALKNALPRLRTLAELPAPGGALRAARLLTADNDGVPLLLLDCDAYYARSGTPYQSSAGADWPDNYLRFGLLSRVAALLGGSESPLDWRPDLVHCNDWPTGATAAFLAFSRSPHAAAVMTVHNLAYQGIFPPTVLEELAIPRRAFAPEGLEYYGQVSFLKAGLHYATRLTTVSPTYAREIQNPPLGFGLDGLLRRRAPDLHGILNGIDDAIWDPAHDVHIDANYDAGRLDAKRVDKAALQRAFGLPEDADAPLLGMVSRLVEQKGIDLVPAIAPSLVRARAQLVVLGRGERRFENTLSALAAGYSRTIGVRIGFEEALAHRIEAGADIYLMPSRFEPCGLNQLYSMRYGTPPIVRHTGGLADSVVDASDNNMRAGTATGFVFERSSAQALRAALSRALEAYRDRDLWRKLQCTGMAQDWSWRRAAHAYLEVYHEAVGVR